MTDCCPVMTLVLGREHRFGVSREKLWNYRTGEETRKRVVIRFPKSKEKTEPHANATWAPFDFCPFCGKHLSEKPGPKKTLRKNGSVDQSRRRARTMASVKP